jgi:hypothetical protein
MIGAKKMAMKIKTEKQKIFELRKKPASEYTIINQLTLAARNGVLNY